MAYSLPPFSSIKKKYFALSNSTLVKNFFIYSFGAIILRGVTVFLAPLMMRILTPSDYGLLSLVNSFTNILVVFAGFGLRQVFSIEYFHCDSNQRKLMINDVITIYLAFSSPIFLLLFLNKDLINHYIFLNSATSTLITISLIYCFTHFFVELFYQLLRYQQKAFALTILQTSIAFITILINFTFVYYFRWGVSGLMLGYLLGMLIAFGKGLYAYAKEKCFLEINVKESLSRAMPYLKLGFPFIPAILCNWVLSSGDKWILARYASLHDVGIYTIADMFGLLYQMIILYALRSSYTPHLMRKYATNQDDLKSVERWNQKNMWVSMIGMASLITAGYLIGKPILYWILPLKYHEAINYIWLVLMGYIFLMGTGFANTLIQFHKKTYFLAFALFVPAMLNIGLNIVLIPYFNIYGCVCATLASYIVYFLLTLWYNHRLQRSYK